MARKNCPVCGSFLKQGRFIVFRCTKCLDHYKDRFRRFVARAASVATPILLVVAILWTSLFAYTMYRMDQALDGIGEAIEELQREVESSGTKVTVEQGDTVWDLLTQELGRYPTWEEIQKVVDANGLENFMDGQGLWIVLIYPGQVLDLSPALGP